MKLNARDARAWIDRPPADRPGTLLYGDDTMRVALQRQDLLANLLGPSAEEEMRITRLTASELRRDTALLADALKSPGFFPGPRAVLVDAATQTHAGPILAALEAWREGDAHMVIAAGMLRASSSLRKVFEKHPGAAAIAIYDDPPDRAQIEAELTSAGLGPIGQDPMNQILELARSLPPGDLRQTLHKIALYKSRDDTPLSPDDIRACAPASTEADLEDLLEVVAEAETSRIGPLLRQIEAQGAQPVSICIGAMRHFRTLHSAASHPGGVAEGVGNLRPPVFGPRRDKIRRQAARWGVHKIEDALHLLTSTDLTLRSSAKAPQMAVMERALIRLAMMTRAG